MAEVLWTLALAGFGGFIRHVQKFAGKKEERPVFEWSVASIDVLTGAFAGVLTLWIVSKKLETNYVHVAIAAAGYAGPLAIEAVWGGIRDVALRFLGAAQGPKGPDAKG